jgi:hypothetical protein
VRNDKVSIARMSEAIMLRQLLCDVIDATFDMLDSHDPYYPCYTFLNACIDEPEQFAVLALSLSNKLTSEEASMLLGRHIDDEEQFIRIWNIIPRGMRAEALQDCELRCNPIFTAARAGESVESCHCAKVMLSDPQMVRECLEWASWIHTEVMTIIFANVSPFWLDTEIIEKTFAKFRRPTDTMDEVTVRDIEAFKKRRWRAIAELLLRVQHPRLSRADGDGDDDSDGTSIAPQSPLSLVAGDRYLVAEIARYAV